MKRPLPTLEEIKEKNITKDSLAKLLLPGITYDCALPQEWLDSISQKYEGKYDLLRSTIVWAYPPHNSMFGEPTALCLETEALLRNFTSGE